jgi:hypothetical protein
MNGTVVDSPKYNDNVVGIGTIGFTLNTNRPALINIVNEIEPRLDFTVRVSPTDEVV